jgi:hypothetical protein
MARKSRPYAIGDRVIAREWRGHEPWERVATVIHTYLSGVDGPVVVLITDTPEPDGAAIFDVRAADVEPTPTAPPRPPKRRS